MSGAEQTGGRRIVPGILVSPAGQATVDPALADVLFDLAVQLEDATPYPVDVQHVVAALLLASRAGQVAPDRALAADDAYLQVVLAEHVKTVFTTYGGKLGRED